MNEKLLPCPFCGVDTLEPHANDCWFTLNAIEASRGKLAQAWNRRATPSTSPASDADPRAAFEAEAGKHGITVERFKNRPDSYKFEHTSAMFRLWMAAWGAALASTRTASDTRTAAGEAECDAALGQ